MKMLIKEVIRLQPVKQLVVVRAGVAALEPGKLVRFAVKLKERTDLLVGVRLDQRGAKAAIVLCVVDQERGPWCAHGDEERIVFALGKVGSILFHFGGVA